MILIVCLDDRDGMMFHHRRQSQDRGVRAYIRQMTENADVYMNAYSRELYQEFVDAVVCEDFLQQAGEGAYCLVEDQEVHKYKNKIERMIVFRWNKVYPSDMVFDEDLSQWNLVHVEEFQGSSHRITKEVYEGDRKL